MGNIIHIATAYIRYYRKQSAALLLGVILSAALLGGMGGLFESGQAAATQNARTEYGDWHYTARGDLDWFQNYEQHPAGEGYHIEKTGMETVRKVIEEPFSIQFVYADDGYMEMMGRTFTEGSYPEKETEIALDESTLQNLGIPRQLGSQVTLDGETFTLCGILTDMPEKFPTLFGDYRQVFVNSTLDFGKNGKFFYIKFDERHKVYKQLWQFCRQFGINMEDVSRNNGIAGYVGAEMPANIWDTIKTGLSHKETGLPYIWGMLNQNGKLMRSAIMIAVAFFGAFIVYSLFQISVIRRMSQYSMMQTIGMTGGHNTGILLFELGCISVVGYPAGCIIGNLLSWLIYSKIGRIFITQNQTVHTGVAQDLEYAAVNLPDAGNYQISWHTMVAGLFFLAAVIVIISISLVRRMNRLTIRQMISMEQAKHPKRKIYSIRYGNMTGILTRKFMFARKGTFLGILFSLSIGSIIFLGSFYVTENTRANNELTFKADDGLGSDIQVYEQSDQPDDTILADAAAKMRDIPGIAQFHPVRYLLGEIPLMDGALLWKEFFAETANDESNPPDPILQEKYNGIVVQTGENDYNLKVNIYGYDDEMLENLKDYLLEGDIDPEKMRADNSVIVKTLMDGQGNYGGIAIQTGDEIQLTTIRNNQVPQEALRFQGKREWYQSRDFTVAALTSRPLAKVDTFIGDNGMDSIDIIMTNEQMEKNFGITDYQTISISLEQGADSNTVSTELSRITSTLDKCIVKDYSQQIAAQNLYLNQKMFFYYGIAVTLLGISLLHIMNSMQYLIVARKHEFGILRAMGITDYQFRKMLAKEGLRYGIYSSLTVVILYFFIQKVLYYFLVHVYLYLHPKGFISWGALVAVILLNLAVCVMVTLVSGKTILQKQIIEEIRE